MPHIIVEYSKTLQTDINISGLLVQLHDALADAGIDKARIKTRGIALEHNVVGDQGAGGKMLHASLLLLEGRDGATKTAYGTALYDILRKDAPENCAVTLEIRDMVKDSYFM